MSRAIKYRNILAHVSSCCSGSTVSSRRLLPLLLTMLICLLTGSPHAQSSTRRVVITASDSIGCDEYSNDVAPPEERTSSSQSHTCKNQPPDCTHLPLNPSAFPLSTHNSCRMQAYSEVVKRHPEAWKTALPSLIPFSRRRSQAIYSTPRSRRHPKSCPRYVRDILDIVAVFSERPRASAALRRARAGALPFSFLKAFPKGKARLELELWRRFR